MDRQPEPQSSARDAYRAIVITLVLGVPSFLFLTILTGGWILSLTFGALGLAILGGLHYLLWGRSLSRQTEGEREEAEIREQMETEEWDMPPPRGPHHHS